jgi:hypothetical protein
MVIERKSEGTAAGVGCPGEAVEEVDGVDSLLGRGPEHAHHATTAQPLSINELRTIDLTYVRTGE